MEAWLKSDSTQFRFPVIPAGLEVSRGYKVDTEYLANGNEVSIFSGRDLIRTSLVSHFPADKDRTYLDFVDFPEPDECVRIIEEIASSKGEIRYIVTETEINMPVRITSFKRGIQDGSSDIYFTLDIVEYSPPQAASWSPKISVSKGITVNIHANTVKRINLSAELRSRITKKIDIKKYHTVKKGDCLWDIAAEYYRDGSLYKKIKQNAENLKNYPSLKGSNLILPGWRLVI